MKINTRRTTLTLILAILVLMNVHAGRVFDGLHAHYREALSSGHYDRAIDLYKPISNRIRELEREKLLYSEKGEGNSLLEVEEILEDYRKYQVTEEEAEIMIKIKDNYRNQGLSERASIFLYENTDYFRPTITIIDELGIRKQVYVWNTKPGDIIAFDHDYDKTKLEGRIFVGYVSAEGDFKKGEAPTFPMSYDSEVWYAAYEYGYLYRDPEFDYEIFYPVDVDGYVRIPQFSWVSDDYKLAGWKEVDTGEIKARKEDKVLKFDGKSKEMQPIWESIKSVQLHLGNNRKNMKHGSRENFYLDIVSASNEQTLFLVEIYTNSEKVKAEKVFSFIELLPGEKCTLGPYSIEALMGKENTNVEFNVSVKAVDSGNQWKFNPNISLR